MKSDARSAVHTLAQSIVDDLADPAEYEPAGGGLLIDEVEVDAVEDEQRFVVSFGARDGHRAVEVTVLGDRDSYTASMAWAAYAIADAFQDEVTELVRAARPNCPGHVHPMRVEISDSATWWVCPKDAETRRLIWPRPN